MIPNPLMFVRSFVANKRGNVLMIFAFAVIPMVFATGMGIDYSRAARLRTKLNAIADAAALAAVSQPQMNNPSDDDAKAVAKKMFDAQAQGLEGLDGYTLQPIQVSHDADQPTSRVVTVSYTAKSLNAFGGVLNMRTITISGTSSATATAAPNIDFYIALDTSPSMALPTTSAGIQTMHNALNCSFACHSNMIENYVVPNTIGKLPSRILNNDHFNITNRYSTVPGPAVSVVTGRYGQTTTYQTYAIDDNAYVFRNRTTNIPTGCSDNGYPAKDICVYNNDGTLVDSYWYALNKGLQLRVTAERGAVQDLMTLAQSYAELNHRQYRAALYTFDHSTQLKTIVAQPSSLQTVSAAVPNINVALVNDRANNGCPLTGCSMSYPNNRYLFTSFKSILDKMTSVLPNSGNGSDEPGDTPQTYLFIVTDGMSDEQASIVHAPGTLGEDRTRSAMVQDHIAQCNVIKKAPRNVKIAILYTEYTAASIEDDEPNQKEVARKAIEDNPTIAKRLSDCASPGLMYTVKTDQSISEALQALFAKAMVSARLNH